MKNKFLGIVLATAGLVLGTGLAGADGLYDLYTIGDAERIGTIEIKDDVSIKGGTYSSWWVAEENIMIYIPTDAAYVTVDANNPVIGKRFEGGWVAHGERADFGSDACEETRKDHTGTDRHAWGDLTWTITSLADVYEFEIHMGLCEGDVEPWAQNVDAKG